MQKNIRWIQRFENYKKALKQLEKAVELATDRTLSDLEKEGLIQRFDAFQLAVNRGLINNGKALMETIKSRNKTAHTYNEATANEIFNDIINEYYSVFVELKSALEKEKQKRNF